MNNYKIQPYTTVALSQTPLWKRRQEDLSREEQVQLTYERCRSLLQHYNMSKKAPLSLSPEVWAARSDPIFTLDGSVGTFMSIHVTLCAGTLAVLGEGRDDVEHLIDDLLAFKICGQFCLTEVAHGLDAINIETTATQLPNGTFDLNTPTEGAAKYMPPTIPAGIPLVAVVYARLIDTNGRSQGIKPFIVHISPDGNNLAEGIECKILTPRGHAKYVRHALTYFRHLRLPSTALLGSTTEGIDPRLAFFSDIRQVISGTLYMGASAVAYMRIVAYIGAKYSLRRHVLNRVTGKARPILSFSTQYITMATAISQALVYSAWGESMRRLFASEEDLYRKHFLAATYKTVCMKTAQSMATVVSDRCGAQGLFEANIMSVSLGDMRGSQIAEGDIRVISIRFAIDVVLGRIDVPQYSSPKSVLARREKWLIAQMRKLLDTKISQGGSSNSKERHHRSETIEAQLLPQALPLVEAIGHRMAYDAAVSAGVGERLMDLFLADIMQLDSSWFSENGGIPRAKQIKQQQEAAWAVYPEINRLCDDLGVGPYLSAPILSNEEWDGYVASLESRVGSVPYADRFAPTKSRL